MSAHGETRQRAYEAACAIATEGRRPTIDEIRTRLGGGGQRAIIQGMEDWMLEVSRRFSLPEIPQPLHALVTGMWAEASRLAAEHWATARGALEGRIAELETETARLVLERDTARAESASATEALAIARAQLHEARDAMDRTRGDLERRTAERDEAMHALAESRTLADELGSKAARAEGVADQARRSLEDAQERLADLQEQLRGAQARTEVLEQTEAAAKHGLARVESELGASHAEAAELRRTLSERDSQLTALTAALQAEQQARTADDEHWLGRIAEVQGMLAEAKERERALLAEKTSMSQEMHRLRQDVRRLTGLVERATPAAPQENPGEAKGEL